MGSQWPPSLRPISKYIQRAEETKQADPIVAYYCTVVALQEGFRIRDPTDQEATKVLTGLLDRCEGQKAALGGEKDEHKAHMEEFALSVFQVADDQDRAGQATRDTAKTFYAAASFLEACKFFVEAEPGEERTLPSDLAEKHKYALWKSKSIIMAFREGRTPTPGPPVSEGSVGSPAPREDYGKQAELGYQPAGGPYTQDPSHASYGHPEPSAPIPTSSVMDNIDARQRDSAFASGASSTVAITPGPPDPDYVAAPDPADVKYPPPQGYGGYPDPGTAQAYPNYHPGPPPDTKPLMPPPRHNIQEQGNAREPTRPVLSPPIAASNPPQSIPHVAIPTPPVRANATPGSQPSFQQISAAQRSAKNAASALDFQDVSTAIAELQKALASLSS